MPEHVFMVRYRYHAVGQGLFVSGALLDLDRSSYFRWVYDCGTSSTQDLIDKALDSPAWSGWPFPPTDDRIELVIISHFDEDHISGLPRLLGRHTIQTLLLPYVPLWSRLALAFERQLTAEDPVFRLFLDPIGYIRALDGGERIGQIVMAPPSAGEGVPPPDDAPPPETPEWVEGSLPLTIDHEPIDSDAADEMMLDPGDRRTVTMLQPNGRLQAGASWEFVPYNDGAKQPVAPGPFRQAVAASRAALMACAETVRGTLPADRGPDKTALQPLENAVKALKGIYESEFKGSKARNMISLFLYSGPLGELDRLEHCYRACARSTAKLAHKELRFDRIAQLFTGDGYLHETACVDALERHLTGTRLLKAGIFQVMHHGAAGNWYQGIAARLAPDISIFSSNPDDGRYHHPHPEVLRDFWPHGPVQVDCDSTLTVQIEMFR